MIMGKKISLVVPCKNEEKIIAAFIKKVPRFIDEILIIDNNSTDKTAVVARKVGARVIVEKKSKNGIGYGYAHISGLEYASGDYIVAMDGDDTYPLASIKPIVAKMFKKHINFVSCNRLPLMNKNAISKTRQLGIKILNWEIGFLYGYKFKDILTGMWIVQKEVLHELKLCEGGWNFSAEIKIEAMTNPRIRFFEYHINHFERKYEPSKLNIFSAGFLYFIYILKRKLTRDNGLLPLSSNFFQMKRLKFITQLF